jgi:hypothetical protein
MVAFALSNYLPLSELAKIVAATLAIAVAAPSAVATVVAGIDRRSGGSGRAGAGLIGAGACALVLLVTVGLYALIDR